MSSGEVERYKACFVAKGYPQQSGIDYKETYSPIAKYDSIRAIFAIAATYNMDMTQFDIKTTYLNSNLYEVIYMEQPKGFEKESKRKNILVSLLKKSLYGLKQSIRQWNGNLIQQSNYMIQYRVKQIHVYIIM